MLFADANRLSDGIVQRLDLIVTQFKILNRQIDDLITPKKRASRFDYAVGPITSKTKGEIKMLEVTITNEQQVKITLNPVTATGKPAPLDGAPTWEVVTGNSTVNVAPDGLSADLISSDDPGDTDFIVKADADLGSGVVEISDIIRLTVSGAQAASLGLVAGEPTAK